MPPNELFRRSFITAFCILLVFTFLFITCHQAFAADDGWITAADNPYNWDPAAEAEEEPGLEPENPIKIILPQTPDPTIGASGADEGPQAPAEPPPQPDGLPPAEAQPPPPPAVPEAKPEDKPGPPESPIVFQVVTIGASRQKPQQPVQLTIGDSSLDDVTAIRRNFDFVLYALFPLAAAVLVIFLFCRWFFRTFIEGAIE